MKRRSTKLRAPVPPSDSPYLDFGDGFQLVVADWPQHIMNLFDERRLHGGGPTSQGLLLVFAQLAEPPITSEFHVGSESSEAWVTSDKDTLDRFAKLIERRRTGTRMNRILQIEKLLERGGSLDSARISPFHG